MGLMEHEHVDFVDEVEAQQAATEKKKEQVCQDEFDFDDGDLALPPPALDLPARISIESSSTIRKRRNRQQSSDWHMSDVPLTPHIKMATDFARGFEVGSPMKATAFSPTLNTHEEHALPFFHSRGHTPETNSEGQSSSNNTKVPSGGGGGGGGDPTGLLSDGEAHAAWWLDINCPTYHDMAELSKMFPLHPLTVEDVLQQDTREKVEMFESLNYYFVVVRAIDEKYFKYTSAASHGNQEVKGETKTEGADEKARHLSASPEGHHEIEMTELGKAASKKPRVDLIEGVGGKEGVEGIGVGAVNLYLIVFSHGVISFHFEDISKHTNRVRSRLLDLTQPVKLTSDWIAHGLFDSIVDAFFPLLSFLETEIEDIEMLTSAPLSQSRHKTKKSTIVGLEGGGSKAKDRSLPIAYLHEKEERLAFRPLPQIALPDMAVYVLPPVFLTRRWCVKRKAASDDNAPPPLPRSFIQRVFGINKKRSRTTAFISNTARDQSTMLRRIADTHKIVTGLSRLLTPKNDSVRGLRKRLVDLRGPSMSMTEMTIYMGDVHDHIVSLLSHLSSSDHRLGDIHFSYLSSIRINNSRVSHSTDEILVILATITVTIVATIYVISIFSLNVRIPHNVRPGTDTEETKGVPSIHHWFGGIVAASCCIPLLIMMQTRRWTRQAKQRTEARRAVR
jgi:Mg2+ and Co2+ transporter CorA